MDCKRHIIMDVPGGDAQIQVFEREGSVVIQLGLSADATPNRECEAIKGMIDAFLASLLAGGCKVVKVDRCA